MHRFSIKRLQSLLIKLTFVSFLSIFSCASIPGNYRIKEKLSYRLPGKTVYFVKYVYDTVHRILWFNVHDDENTAVRAAKSSLLPGTLMEIKHGGGRNIRFRLNGKTYRFDPNRIYPDTGRYLTLIKLSAYSPQADSVVKHFARFITDNLMKSFDTVVTLHNNTNGHYSVMNYMPGGPDVRDAQRVFYAVASDPDDFFYCTDAAIYEAIIRKGFNALCQNNDSGTDDGSLSVYCGKNRIPYVNIEAQRGHLRQQKSMIRILDSILQSHP